MRNNVRCHKFRSKAKHQAPNSETNEQFRKQITESDVAREEVEEENI